MAERRTVGQWIGDVRPAQVGRTFQKYTGNPLGGAAAVGLGLGGLAYAFAPSIRRGMIRYMPFTGTPEERAQMLAEAEGGVSDAQLRRRMGLFGLTLGALGTLYTAYDPAKGAAGLLKWGSEYDPGYTNALHNMPTIPINASLDLIWGDKYLNSNEKVNAASVFHGAGQGSVGLLNKGDLVRGAVRAGFGFTGGYVAGQALGTVFGLPAKTKARLSQIGGIAMALKNTGVF